MSSFATNFKTAVYNLMANDATLCAMLSKYQGEPAIFTGEKLPEGAEMPFVVTYGNVSDIPYDNKEVMGREVIRDIYCYCDNEGSTTDVDDIAGRIVDLFHGSELTVTGYQTIYCFCQGITSAPSSQTVSGRIVTIHVIGVYA